MSAPVTEAHRSLCDKISEVTHLRQYWGRAEECAQWAADSEARAVEAALATERSALAKKEGA